MKKFVRSIILASFIISLNGCAINDFFATLEKEYTGENEYSFEDGRYINKKHADTGKSIETLYNAFNAKTNDKNESLYDSYDENLLYSNIDYNSEKVKDINLTRTVQELEENKYSTPTKGDVRGLVVPIDFVDSPASFANNAYMPSYHSVTSYYYNSSYGKLNMSFDVVDWFRMRKNSSYYEKLSDDDYYGKVPGVSAIVLEVLSSLSKYIDLSLYDNDKDGEIDLLYIIYNHKVTGNFWWAFHYGVFERKKFDGVYPCKYVFAGYSFLNENNEHCNTKTYIHESGHNFGLIDYYDDDMTLGSSKGGLGGADMMDCNYGDHNAYSKMVLGWIDKVFLINLDNEESYRFKLPNFSNTGAIFMFTNNNTFNKDDDIFQEYFLLEYYDCSSLLNKGELFTTNGLILYHINGQTETVTENNLTYKTLKYNNSTTNINLIDKINHGYQTSIFPFVSHELSYLYSKSSSKHLVADDYGLYQKGNSSGDLSSFGLSNYSFYVEDINGQYASIIITHK